MGEAAFRKDVLDNGVTLVMERHPHVRGVAIGVWIKVGSADESPREAGLSHFLEHMVFKGTTTRDPLAIASSLESVGGELNAFTDKEYTCYHATVLSEHVDLALQVLSDISIHPTFPPKEIEREKKVLLQEMAMVEETPDDWISTLLCQMVWPEDPLGLPILGNRKSVLRFSRKQIASFFTGHYCAENVILSIAGDIEFNEARERCERYFRFPSNQRTLPLKKRVAGYRSRRKSLKFDSDQLHLMLSYEGVGLKDPARFEALVLSCYLGGGMSSRLFQEIREKAALAYSVDCEFAPFAESGLMTFYSAMSQSSVRKCLSIIGREIEALQNQGISENDLDRVKGQLKGMIQLTSDSMETRQESLGRNEIIFGRYVPTDEVLAEIDKVSSQGIRALANRLFVPEKESAIALSRQTIKGKDLTVFA